MLKIGIHQDRRIGGLRGVYASRQGSLLAEIAGELQQTDRARTEIMGVENGKAVVATAVVNENEPDGQPELVRQSAGNGFQPVEQLGQHRGLVVDWNDNRQGFSGHDCFFAKMTAEDTAKLMIEATPIATSSATVRGKPA